MKQNKLLILSALLTALFMIIMAWHGKPLRVDGITPRGIIDLELARTSQRALQIYTTWGPALRMQAIVNTYIDFIFLISYGTLLFTLTNWAVTFNNGIFKLLGGWLPIAMIVAAFFDVVENMLMLKTLRGSMGNELVASTYMFATVKFGLIALGILYLAVTLVVRLVRGKKVANTSQNFIEN